MVHIITPQRKQDPLSPLDLLSCQGRGRDRQEDEEGGREGGEDRGESGAGGGNEEEDFLRGQVRAQRAQSGVRVVMWLNKSPG